ncbi:MAG TPA: ABC transporter ATP-binding protein [Gammaproteobacteria bacterium]
MSGEPLLSIENLVVEFRGDAGTIRAVDGLTLAISPGERVGLVGESGCGKSVTALALLGLVPSPPGRIAAGRVLFDGRDLTTLRETEMRRVRGAGIAMIFQEPMTALNPVFTIGSQMTEVLRRQRRLSPKEAKAEAIEWLDRVGIPDPVKRLGHYPHELSGGMRQRVMIAMALSCRPKLLIADEPTTALDVTIQAQVLDLMRSLTEETGAALILITHDLGVVAETCRRACVMYTGKLVEDAPVETLFAAPRHPYTSGLLASVPRVREDRLERLPTIPGMVPDLARLPAGCSFRERCPNAVASCRVAPPPLRDVGVARVACYNPVAA